VSREDALAAMSPSVRVIAELEAILAKRRETYYNQIKMAVHALERIDTDFWEEVRNGLDQMLLERNRGS